MKSIKTVIIAVLAMLGLLPAASSVKKNVETVKSVYAGKIGVSLDSTSVDDPGLLKLCKDDNGQYRGKFVVKVYPVNFRIPGIALEFNFDKTKVNVDSVFFHPQFGASIWNESDANSEGILKLTGLSLQKELLSAPFDLAEIQIFGLEEGLSKFQLTDDYQIVFEDAGDSDQSDNVLEIDGIGSVKMEIMAEGECRI
jgi:hypothetical protein